LPSWHHKHALNVASRFTSYSQGFEKNDIDIRATKGIRWSNVLGTWNLVFKQNGTSFEIDFSNCSWIYGRKKYKNSTNISLHDYTISETEIPISNNYGHIN
jgi:hypothetical protein